MPELMARGREAVEGLKGIELIPTGVDVLRTPFGNITVIKGKDSEGKDTAILRGVDQEPLPSLLRFLNQRQTDNSDGGGLGDFIRSSRFAKLLGELGMAGSVILGAAACSNEDNHSAQSAYSASEKYATQSAALTSDQLGNLKGQPLPTTKYGDIPANHSIMNGKHYLFIKPGNPSESDKVVYIECDKLADCLSASAQRKYVEGLDSIGNGTGFNGTGVFQDETGKNKFTVIPPVDKASKLDVSINPNTGNLVVDKNTLEYMVPAMASPISLVQENGVPHALRIGSGLQDVNLHDKSTVAYPLKNTCAAPTLDGNLAIKAHSQVVMGVLQCQLYWADSLANLVTKAAPITSLNQTSPSKMVDNPHLATAEDGSGVLFYSVEEANGTRIYYALLLPPKPADTDTSGDTTSDDADAGAAPDADAEVDVPAPVDVPAEVTAAVDAVIDVAPEDIQEVTEDVPPDLGPDVPPDLPPDVEDIQPDLGPDLGPDVPPELPPVEPDVQVQPDITPDGQPDVLDASKVDVAPACTETLPEFTLATGNCKLTVCPKNYNALQGHTVEVNGDGSQICSADITVNGKPATLTLSSNGSGKIQITCEIFTGESPICDVGVDTTAKVDETGAGTKLKTPVGISLGSGASSFSMTPRADGSFEVASFNLPNEPKVIITFTDLSTIEVPSDGIAYKVEQGGKVLTPIVIPVEDAGSDASETDAGSLDAAIEIAEADIVEITEDVPSELPVDATVTVDIQVEKDVPPTIDSIPAGEVEVQGSKDGGQTAEIGSPAETQGSADAGSSETGGTKTPPATPKEGGSCSAAPLSQSNPTAFGIIIAAAALALGTYRRKLAYSTRGKNPRE